MWQGILSVIAVGAAAVYLVWRFWRRWRRGEGPDCAFCPCRGDGAHRPEGAAPPCSGSPGAGADSPGAASKPPPEGTQASRPGGL